MEILSGTYKIINKTNGKAYYGSSTNLIRRKIRHFKDLENNCHTNQYLQNAYNKDGKDSFCFEILKLTSKENLMNEEQQLLTNYYGCDCYNICPTAGSPFKKGRRKTDVHKKKLSASVKKYFESHPSARTYRRSLRLGTRMTPEQRKKLSDGHKRGSFHHNARLTEKLVLEIRSKYIPWQYSFNDLAKEYRVDKKTIIRIIHKKTWTHI